MAWLVLYVLGPLLPTIVVYAILLAGRGYGRLAESRRGPPPAPEPLERIVTRLRRLRAELEATENTRRGPARQHHLRAVRGAYLDMLHTACARPDVNPPPGGYPARQAATHPAPAALRGAGGDAAAGPRG